MIKIRLETTNGELVGYTEIPLFGTLPEVMIRGTMIKIRLETTNGELVGYTEIPLFGTLPEVMIRGTRVFKRKMESNVGGPHVYAECFFWTVVTEVTAE